MNALTLAESDALRALEETPFFVSTATNDILSTDDFSLLWEGRKAELDAKRLQPYSDILFEEIHHELMGMKAELSAALKAKILSSSHPSELSIPFRSFFSAYEPSWPRDHYEGSDSWNAMVEFGREEYVRAQTILENCWDARIGIWRDEDAPGFGENCGCWHHRPYESDDETIIWAGEETSEHKSWLLPPVRTYNIVKKTDLLQRLGTIFGPNFYVTLKSEPEERVVGGRVYAIYRNTFLLHYMPHPPLHRKKSLAATLVKYATHENYKLTYRDTVVGLLGEKVVNSLAP